MKTAKRIGLLAGLLMVTFLAAVPASATHSWGGYHWARTANPFTLKLGDNVSGAWDSYLEVASVDWSTPTGTATQVLITNVVPGSTDPRRCKPSSGRVQVCDASYGYNGWLGVAQIWISGSHITQGTVRVNDSYFSLPTYNNPNEKQHVMCQEIGHTLGLDHQSTSGASLNTCMDYFSNTGANAGSKLSIHPNQHDYDELGIIYSHLDTTLTIKLASKANGQAVGDDGELAPGLGPEDGDVYEKDLGGGKKLITIVTWAAPGAPRDR